MFYQNPTIPQILFYISGRKPRRAAAYLYDLGFVEQISGRARLTESGRIEAEKEQIRLAAILYE